MPDEGHSAKARAARRIDPAGLTGAWVNTESSPRGVASVVIERRPGALGIWALGADDQTCDGWGWTDAEDLYAASASGDNAVAFTAAYLVKSVPVALHANVSKGLLIVSSFQRRFQSGNSDARFAREFFHRASSGVRKSHEAGRKQSAAATVAVPSSASTFDGTWRNTNSEGPDIVTVSFAAADDGSTMRIFGRDGSAMRDWGTTAAQIYTEVGTLTEPAKIQARYDLGSMVVLLHGWVKQGVLVLALFRQFKNETSGSNYFDREFFFRTDEPPGGIG